MPRECADLVWAWIATSEDPVCGVDQTSHLFYLTMFQRYCSLMPEGGANSKQYKGHQLRPVRETWEAMTGDCQNFRSAIRFIYTCKPTGVTEDEIMSMVIAKHLGKRASMSYDARNFSKDKWVYHQAFPILRRVPKFQGDVKGQNEVFIDKNPSDEDEYTMKHDLKDPNQSNEIEDEDSPEISVSHVSGGTGSASGTVNDSDNNGVSTANDSENERSVNRGGHPGRKKAKKES